MIDDEQQSVAPSAALSDPKPPQDKWGELIDQMDREKQVPLRQATVQAQKTSPDRAADVLRLSNQTGIPSQIVDRDYEQVKQRTALETTPFDKIATQTPHLAAWAGENPHNAAAASDDMDKLGALEWLVTMPARAVQQGIDATRASMLKNQAIYRPLTQAEHDQLNSYEFGAQNGGALGASNSWFAGALTGLMRATPMMVGAGMESQKYGMLGAIAGTLAGPGSILTAPAGYAVGSVYGAWKFGMELSAGNAHQEFSQIRDEHGNTLDPQVVKVASIATGLIDGALMAGGYHKLLSTVPGLDTLGRIGAKKGVALALQQPSVRAALGNLARGFAGNITYETTNMVGQRAVEIIAGELGKVVNEANGSSVLAPGQTERGNVDLYRQPSVPNADGSHSTVDSIGVNIDGREVLLPQVTPDGRHLNGPEEAIAEYQKTGRHLGMFTTPEQATEFAKKLHDDYAAGKYASGSLYKSPSDVLTDLGHSATQAFQDFALLSLAGPAMSFVRDTQRAKAAAQGVTFFQALGEGVTQSKLVERLPAAAQAFLERATKDGPIEKVYAPVDTFVKYWQDKGVDPAQMADTLTGEAGALDRAQRTGEDLAIPTARYATKLAGTEHNAFFANELRLGPEEMNGRESRDLQQKIREMAVPDQAPSRSAEIADHVTEQLVAAGVPEETARGQARLYEAAFGTMAEKAGVDPVELYRSYGLTVARPDLEAAAKGAQAGATTLNQALPPLVDEGGRPLGGRLAAPEAVFLAYGPSGALYNVIGGEHDRSTVSAEKLAELGIQVPDTPVDTGEKLSGAELRQRALDARAKHQTPTMDQADYLGGRPVGDNVADAAATLRHENPRIDAMAAQAKAKADAAPRLKDTLGPVAREHTGAADPGTGTTTLFQSATPDWRFDVAPVRFEDGRALVSTRVPSGPNALPAADVLRTDLQAVLTAPGDLVHRMAAAIGDLPHLTEAEKALPSAEKLEQFVQRANANLRFLWNQYDPQLRERAKLWYVGAHKIAGDLALAHDVTREQASAVLAMLSPQMDWFKNVALAQRLTDIFHANANSDTVFDSKLFDEHQDRILGALEKTLTPKINKGQEVEAMNVYAGRLHELKLLRKEVVGKKWSELPLDAKAIMLRSQDERTSREYHVITPEGDRGGLATNQDGTPSKIGWGTFMFVQNAISVLEDGSIENINKRLGGEHKVRSFFNNISDPDSPLSVTIDTHAIAAALLEPLAGTNPEVVEAMGGPGSAAAGISGTNPLYAEAYFRLAEQLSAETGQTVLPREVQSVTWEAVRGLFSPGQKKAGLQSVTRGLWEDFHRGKISLDDVQQRLVDAGAGIDPPAWSDTSPRVAADEGIVRAGDGGDGQRSDVPAGRGSADLDPQGSRGPRAGEPDGLVSRAAGGADRVTLPQGERGYLRFGPDRQMSIALLERADLSTFLHETGHLFLEVFGDLAKHVSAIDEGQRTAGQHQLLGDYGKVLQAFGVDGREGITTEHHESFARAFEAYLMEGKAPALELQGAFSRFRSWLVGIYKTVKDLNVNLTPEVRGVFDRMLASDHAIDLVEAQKGVRELFTTPESAGMSPQQFELYRKDVQAASDKAREALDRRLLVEVQREQQQAWKDRRSEIRGQVENETHQEPVYRALAAITKGTHPNGDPLVEGVDVKPLKLDRAAFVAEFGEERAKGMPRGVFTNEGGISAQMAAELFGFSSGDEMASAIADAPAMKQAIENETHKRMLQEQGSVLLDGSISEKAQAAVANETRDKVIRAELLALAKKRREVAPFVKAEQRSGKEALRQAQRERVYERRWMDAEHKLAIADAQGAKQEVIDQLTADVRELKAKARGGAAEIRASLPDAGDVHAAAVDRVAQMKIRNIDAGTFWAAATRAGDTAVGLAARQDFDGAIKAKTQELVNLALYREAVKAKDDVDQRVRFAKGLGKPSTRQMFGRAGQAYLDQVDGVLDRFEFAKVTQKVLDRRAAVRDFVAGLEAQGVPVELPQEILDDSRRMNYSELTVEKLRGITDGLKTLMHLARSKDRLLKAIDEQQFSVVRDSVVASIEASGAARPVKLEIVTSGEKRVRTIQSWIASHTKLAEIVHTLDGHVDGGPMWNAFVRPLNDAAARKEQMHMEASKALREILEEHYTWQERRDLKVKTFIPAIGDSLSKEGRLAVALNWGNEGNRQRLMESGTRRWNEQQVQAILDSLDARDLKFVQKQLDFINSYWDQIAAKQERVLGIAPEKVEAASWFHATEGLQKGGYYPIAYDGRLSIRQGNIIDADQGNLQQYAGYTYATTKRGYTKERQERVNAPVRLELGVGYQHVEAVIHDLTHHEPLIDIGRLMIDSKVQNAIQSRGGDIAYSTIKGTLVDVALGNRQAATQLDKVINYVRAGSTVAGIGWNALTALHHLSGVFNGMATIGPEWVARGMVHVFRDAASMEYSARWVENKSEMMRNRHRTADRDVADLRSELVKGGSWFDSALRTVSADHLTQKDITDSYMALIGSSIKLTSLPIWIGGYEKALAAEPGNEARAIAMADQGVLDSLGGGQVKDLASIQRGGAAMKLFTTFYTYGSLLFNQTHRTIDQTNFRSAGSVGQMATNMMLLYIAPALFSVGLAKTFGKAHDDEGWVAPMAKEMFAQSLNMMVGLRELGAGLTGVFGKELGLGGTVRGYEGPPGLRIVSGTINLAKQAATGDLTSRGVVRSAEDVAGVIFHLPLAQVQRSIDGWAALSDGTTRNPGVLLTGPPPKK